MTTRSTSSVRGRAIVLSALAVAAVTAGRDAQADPARHDRRALTYNEAVALLQVPARWCEGAAALARLGDRRAIVPLSHLVARTEEGLPDRGCVHDALDKLGVRDEVVKLVASTEMADRRTAIELMNACPADTHAPILARLALHDPAPDLRGLAARTLRTQKVTTAWDTAMLALLDAVDRDTRELAATSLQRRFGTAILAALRKRLGTEPQAAVRAALQAAIRRHADHAPARP
jgi:hypothetical protein